MLNLNVFKHVLNGILCMYSLNAYFQNDKIVSQISLKGEGTTNSKKMYNRAFKLT